MATVDTPAERTNEHLQLDYEQTLNVWRMLADTRFKLLAFVPPITAAVVALAGQKPSVTSSLVAAAALTALLGVIMYDLRNTVFYDAAVHRAKHLEIELGMPHLSDKGKAGGLLNERPVDKYRLFGMLVWHDRGLFIVYSASAASLAGLFTLGIVTSLEVSPSWRATAVTTTAAAVFATLLITLHRYSKKILQPKPPPADPRPSTARP